jgi:NAD(P)H-hydrate epimerase
MRLEDTKYCLLSVQQMRAAEAFVFAQGMESYSMMRRAGEAVADAVMRRYPGRRVLVLCGPGNNGGDGFVAAQALQAQGAAVQVAASGDVNALRGDAARAAGQYTQKVQAFSEAMLLDGNPVIVDALFGIGLARPVTGAIAAMIEAVNARGMDVMAVDVPSGVDADSGAVLGVAMQARATVTFGAKKYGHLLMPARLVCGDVQVADIGIGADALGSVQPAVYENALALWADSIPWPQPQHHKYNRGDTLVVGGPMLHAGAAKLAATAALRTGSGLVSIVCAAEDAAVYAATALSLMTDLDTHWEALMKDLRRNTVLIGPGAGVGDGTRAKVLSALGAGKRAVLDADALTSFAAQPHELFSAIKTPAILTPHEGEFKRLFSHITEGSKLEKTLQAAALSGAVVVLKGYDTVIAAPDGRACINSNAPANLATAGSGDVLSGICAGFLAQGIDAFAAACAAVWVHGQAAKSRRAGLISEDLVSFLPSVLEQLKAS